MFFSSLPDVSTKAVALSKSSTSSIVLPEREILEELILRKGLAAGALLSCIRGKIGVHNNFVNPELR